MVTLAVLAGAGRLTAGLSPNLGFLSVPVATKPTGEEVPEAAVLASSFLTKVDIS